MQKQFYKIDKFNSFNLKHIFECGQCFRWNLEKDNSFTGVIGNNVLNIKEENNKIIFNGMCEDDISILVTDYFNLELNYEHIKEKLSKVDDFLKTSIEFGSGIRILKQDLWETIISFIISANNNIPRIKGIIERISKQYGKQIKYNEKTYYTFPTVKELSQASVEDLRKLGLGFRDKRIFDTTKMFIDGIYNIEEMKKIKETNQIRQVLLELPGVGPKVADCILLFSFNRFDVFPVDVWVRRVMNELYIKNKDETKIKKEEIMKLANAKYADLAGIAQQYLFYWKRETA